MRGTFRGSHHPSAADPEPPKDSSIGPLFPLTVTVTGDPNTPETVRYVALDLHDATAAFDARRTYAEARADAEAYLRALRLYGSREKLRLARRIHATKGCFSWSEIPGPDFEIDGAVAESYSGPPESAPIRTLGPDFEIVKPEEA